MSAAYFRAQIPEPYRILGLRLKPLSVGRYRLLKRFGVAFVSDEERTIGIKELIPDLVLGVLICSMACDAFLEWAQSRSFRKDVSRWYRKLSRCPRIGRLPWIGRWWRKHFSFDAFEKMALFRKFIQENSQIPQYWDQGETDANTGHWSHSMEVALRAHLGWSAHEINEQPLSKAIADYFKYAESQGVIRLMTEEESEQGEKNAKIIKAWLEAQGKSAGKAAEHGA